MESGLFSLFTTETLESQNMFSHFRVESLESQNQFSFFGVETLDVFPVSGVNSIPLFINGSFGDPSNSGIPLYISGIPNVLDSGIPLYIRGHEPLATGIPLYIQGHVPVATGIPLFIWGYDTAATGIPLYTFGVYTAATGIPLYMYGYDTKTSGIPLYMAGHIPDSGKIPLYIQGHEPSERGMNLYIGDLGTRMDAAIPLFIQNPGAYSGLPLSIWGIGYGTNVDSTLNGMVEQNWLNLYIEGQGAGGSIPLYIAAPTGTVDNNMNLYIKSIPSGEGSIPLFIDSYDSSTSEFKLYTHGF